MIPKYSKRTALAALAVLGVAALCWAADAGLQLIARIPQTYTSSSFFPATSPTIRIDRTRNAIVMGGAQQIYLTALAGPRQEAMSFRMDLLTNPEIEVAKGTRLTFNVINISDGLVHDFDITSQPPPYPEHVQATPVGTGTLAPYDGKKYTGTVLILKALTPGTYYYVCTVPGHAKAGMYGKIVVQP